MTSIAPHFDEAARFPCFATWIPAAARTIAEVVEILKVFDLDKEADAVEAAVKEVLKEGYRTADIMSAGCQQVSCTKMGDLIVERVHK